MIVLLPVYMFFLGLFAVGVGWIVSSLHVYLRDTAQALGVLINLWFWITPIMISEKQAIKVPFVHGLGQLESDVLGGERLPRPAALQPVAGLAGAGGDRRLFDQRCLCWAGCSSAT